MPYEDWDAGEPFPAGSENRKFTCPAWWYHIVDYKKKPDWKECGMEKRDLEKRDPFSDCKHFCNKAQCWKRWDREIANEELKS